MCLRPGVPFTRAGCDVGAFSTANIVLERAPVDVDKVFGPNSPQAMESQSQQVNDFIGASIHCALGASSAPRLILRSLMSCRMSRVATTTMRRCSD